MAANVAMAINGQSSPNDNVTVSDSRTVLRVICVTTEK